MNTVLKSLGKFQKGQGGFTLIELLIVIIILGILAAVVAFNVGGFLGAGTEETAKTEAASLQTAIIAAMAACSVGTVTAQSNVTGDVSAIEVVNASVADPDSDGLLGTYLQSQLQGTYSWSTNGTLTAGIYSGGGKTCTLTNPAANVWNCTS